MRSNIIIVDKNYNVVPQKPTPPKNRVMKEGDLKNLPKIETQNGKKGFWKKLFG